MQPTPEPVITFAYANLSPVWCAGCCWLLGLRKARRTMPLITERVELAREGKNDKVICRMRSGWAVMGDVQFLPGYSLLLPDPVVPSLNDLNAEERLRFLEDMARLGDALLQTTGAARINYEILGNSEPELHAHVFPRFVTEPEDKRRRPVWFYDWANAVPYSSQAHGKLHEQLRAKLQAEA
jgi:diadenosine tetraphosphate (Ap4A) HIT family hydrolase